MNRLKEFFWLCAGVNKSILSNCPSESSKYVGIGATIFFTGVFAALAGGYALYTIFDSYWIAATFGIIWGLMIFNLDRFIVSSMRKNGDSKQEWISAIPRLILAIIISVVIAKPLELKIFEKEVEAEISHMIQEDLAAQEHTVKMRFNETRERLNAEILVLKNEIAEKANKRDELRKIAQEEADGTGGSKQRNAGPIYQIKKADADKVEAELKALTTTNSQLINEKELALAELDEQEKAALGEMKESQLTGLASRIEALDRLTDKSSAIWAAHWFILLLFLAVETAPVFVKLISQRGPYDFVLKKEEYGVEASYYEDLAKVNAIIKKRSTRLTEEEIDYVQNRLSLSLEKT
ncbi:protein of unknown function [Ekhidna lutea]|uniref:DUF4407 domain-containing protein n=1 Tax=Ekhidna lutea TaxID=447679 RepID=A0A239MAN2_EKHLU|nr:DUF4407 domain-containing protein [Ekhidna lutea]SNT39795.1 protein of unknown function [Ekhidna lutea]